MGQTVTVSLAETTLIAGISFKTMHRARFALEDVASGKVDLHTASVNILADPRFKSAEKVEKSRKLSDVANASAGIETPVAEPRKRASRKPRVKAVKPESKPEPKPPMLKTLPESAKPKAGQWPARAVCDAARKAAMAHYNLTTNPGWQIWLGFVPAADMPAAAQAYLDAQAI